MWSAVRLYSETSGNSKAMAAKNAHPTMATVAISLSRRGSTRIVDADTVLPSLGNSLPALLNDTPARTNVPLSRVYSPNHVELDFSQLRAKGVGYARHQSAQREVIEMRTLPTEMIRLLSSFVPLFSRRVWPHVQVLLIGAILAPGKRTVSSALHAMGLSQEERFHRYHRVLSRASWSSREVIPSPFE